MNVGIIYETINLWNQKCGIEPYIYSGSDWNNNPHYFGSNKELKEDITRLGTKWFKKEIRFMLPKKGSNYKHLRKIESEIQKSEDHRNDSRYYNKTNHYSPGCGQKGMKHSKKFERSKKWVDSMTGTKWSEESKNNRSGEGNPMHGKKVKESTKILWRENGRNTGEKCHFYGKKGVDSPVYGYKHTKKECEQRSKRIKQMFINNPEMRKNASERMSSRLAKKWEITSPTGDKQIITNLKKFADSLGIKDYVIRRSLKGWKTVKIDD